MDKPTIINTFSLITATFILGVRSVDVPRRYVQPALDVIQYLMFSVELSHTEHINRQSLALRSLRLLKSCGRAHCSICCFMSIKSPDCDSSLQAAMLHLKPIR